MTPAEQAALGEAARARAAGGLALFQCPRFPGGLRLRPAACADAWQRRADAGKQSGDWLRLSQCAGCPVGRENAAAGALAARDAAPVGAGARGSGSGTVIPGRGRPGARVPARGVVGRYCPDTLALVRAGAPGLTAEVVAQVLGVSQSCAMGRLARLRDLGLARLERGRQRTPGRWVPA